jgi:hypothetical protein
LWVVLADGTTYGPLGIGGVGVAASGDLTGFYPGPTIAVGAVSGAKIANNTITITNIAGALQDPAAASPGLRTLGTGAAQAAAGNDPRLTNSRVPSGSAGGDLASSTYPNPVISKFQGFPVSIVAPAVNDVVTWNGAAFVVAPGGVEGKELVFNVSVVGVAPLVIGAVYLALNSVYGVASRALIGTTAGGTATLQLRRQTTGVLLPGASWAVTGALADVVSGAPFTVTATDWYTIELLGDAGPTISLAYGLRLVT